MIYVQGDEAGGSAEVDDIMLTNDRKIHSQIEVCGLHRVASIDLSATVCMWDADTGNMLTSVVVPPGGEAHKQPNLCCNRGGNRFVASSGALLCIVDLQSHGSLELIRTMNTSHNAITALCMNADGNRVLTGHDDGYLCYWNIECDERLWSDNVHDSDAVEAVDISADEALIVSGAFRVMRLCSAATGETLWRFTGHTGIIPSIRFNLDSSRIASSCFDYKAIYIWNICDGPSYVMKLTGHADYITSMSYCSDEIRLASSSFDGSVIVWDLECGVCLLQLKGHTSFVVSVSFSSDGSRIASGGYDNVVIIWDVASGCEVTRLVGHTNVVTGVCCVPEMSDYLLK